MGQTIAQFSRITLQKKDDVLKKKDLLLIWHTHSNSYKSEDSNSGEQRRMRAVSFKLSLYTRGETRFFCWPSFHLCTNVLLKYSGA